MRSLPRVPFVRNVIRTGPLSPAATSPPGTLQALRVGGGPQPPWPAAARPHDRAEAAAGPGRGSTWLRHVTPSALTPRLAGSAGSTRPLPFCVRMVSPLVRSPNTARGPSIAAIFPPGRGARGRHTAEPQNGQQPAMECRELRLRRARAGGAVKGRVHGRPPNPGARCSPVSNRDWSLALNKATEPNERRQRF